MDKIKALQYLMSISENKKGFENIYDDLIMMECPDQWGLPKIANCKQFIEDGHMDCEDCWKEALTEAILG